MPLVHALSGFLVDVAQHDLGALLGQPDGAGLPDALGRACDERLPVSRMRISFPPARGGAARRWPILAEQIELSDERKRAPEPTGAQTARARRQRPATSRNGDHVSAGNFHQT